MQSPQTSQQSLQDQPHEQSSQSSHSNYKREKEPIHIIDSVSHKNVDLEKSVPSANISSTITTTITDENGQKDSVTDSPITNTKSTSEANKSQKQAAFQKRFAALLHPNAPTDKNANQTLTEEKTNENQTEDAMLQSTSSTSSFRSGSISNKSSTKPQAKTDPNQQFLREVTSILNKVTPQTYDISLKKFDDLELNCAERLEGMVYLIYIKAVEAAIFCSLYAKLCIHFQKKQVTVPNKNGQPVTLYFRQILLTLCQKEFENYHRQEIEYEKRKLAVDAITDEKVQKEAKEQLEEDLYKAKRKKFGNIIFIGELFKLQMLTDTVMYDCIDYLLQDKTNEENLECLCKILRSIGKELDNKASEKAANRKNLEKNYGELVNIVVQRQTSARIRFMIEDLMEQRKADWVARRAPSNDKQNSGQLAFNLAPQVVWRKGSGVEKKSEDDRSNTDRTGKPPVGHNQQFRPKTGTLPGYATQRQPARELARENSLRDRENNNTSITNSHEGSCNTSFDEEKTQTHVHSLIEEYRENYLDNNDRLVNEALEDLSSFCTGNIDQQGIIVRELFTNVLEAKSHARKAVGQLLDAALHKNIISTEGFLSGIKMFIEVLPDYAVDIPFIWQYIGEIIGAFIGGSSSNMILLKPILQLIPDAKTKQLFQDIIRYAVEFSSKRNVQNFWQSTGFSLNDLLKSDSSFLNEYIWLSETTNKENLSPHADPQLIKLFKSINDQGTAVTDDDILLYIRENINSKDKFYTRNIVLSYLEACLINHEPRTKIQEDIAKKRMTVLNAIIEHKPEEELQAIYAIQNFVNKLEHPPKMSRLLFDIFYNEECVSEEAFFEWLRQPDQSETEGHAVVLISTQDFFI